MATGDSDDEAGLGNRRVVDFDPEDQDWEERGGCAAHRARDNYAPQSPLHPPLDSDREEHANALAEKRGLKVKEVCQRMLLSTTFKPRRKVSTYNAKISRIMTDLNEGRGIGERYTMLEVKRMVREEPSMLEAFTEEEVEEMVRETLANRNAKSHGTRANNRVASADVRLMLECLMVKITALAERAGMIGFAMFSRGHIHDKTIPVTIQSWGALEFIREVLKRDPTDVAALFELWATRIQKECTAIIKAGLQNILGHTKVAMNYESYIKLLMLGKNIGIVNWPQGVDFKRMSLQSAIGPLRILYDSLKCGTTRWKVLSTGEKKQLIANHDTMVAAGEGGGEEAEVEAEEDSVKMGNAQRRRAVTQGTGSGLQGRTEADDGEGDIDKDEEDGPRKPITQMSVEEKRVWLLKLGRVTRRRQEGRKKDGEDGKSGEGRIEWKGKRKRVDEMTKPAKRKKGGQGDEGSGRRKKRRAPDDDDDDTGRKQKKQRVEEPPLKPRPKPTPA
ncbi:hypothetical protein B0H14DRAFT_3463206 [Mycena olivaceomarginata]|nr:hypothetical protein B0H14DRAFT_3463206 [Mycena olivaceomarginata]